MLATLSAVLYTPPLFIDRDGLEQGGSISRICRLDSEVRIGLRAHGLRSGSADGDEIRSPDKVADEKEARF